MTIINKYFWHFNELKNCKRSGVQLEGVVGRAVGWGGVGVSFWPSSASNSPPFVFVRRCQHNSNLNSRYENVFLQHFFPLICFLFFFSFLFWRLHQATVSTFLLQINNAHVAKFAMHLCWMCVSVASVGLMAMSIVSLGQQMDYNLMLIMFMCVLIYALTNVLIN